LDYVGHFRREVAAFEAAGREAAGFEAAPAVPSCPEWVVTDLVLHLGVVHRSVARVISERIQRLGFPSQRGEILLRERSSPMGETRRKFDKDFREGAVRLVRETGKPIAQVARDLGINSGTLGNWVDADRRRRGEGDGALGEDERAELARLRKENAELAMRCDVLKRSVALWVQDAMGR
jgi:transposase